MSILSDREIERLCREEKMIEPFVSEQVQKGIISYGVSSYGYDIRLDRKFKIFHNAFNTLVDPKKFDQRSSIDYEGDYIIIPPNSFILGKSIEYFRIPRDILVICLGKSTYARCGIIVNVTPLEPEWEGYLVIEISNSTPLPVKVYANEGIAQLIFLRASKTCRVSYKDKKGKYDKQKSIVLSKVK